MAISISTVTPVYCGAKYLRSLVRALDELRASIKQADAGLALIESIFVVDEAIDNSEAILRELSLEYDWIRVITLSSNFGQHPATIAGMLYSSGDWVITMDEDLQHHPKYVLSLLDAAVQNSSDICYANSLETVHNSFMRDRAGRFFKWIMAKMLNNPHTRDFNSFRAIRGEIARGAASICRHETYLDIALSWFTKRIVTQDVILYDDRNQQKTGDSGYSFIGLVKHSKRMIMSSKLKILRLAIPVGIIAVVTSIILGVAMAVAAITNYDLMAPRGWVTTILLVLSFGGITVFMLSLLLESMGDLMLNTNGKPTFFVVDRSKDGQLKAALDQISYETASEA